MAIFLVKGSLVELPLFGTYWVYELGYNFGNHLVIQSRMSRTSTFLLACTEHRLVHYSPACDLRTLGLTYIMPQSSLHSVPFTDNSLFCDGNNPGKPFCIALLSFAPAFLGYDWILCCRKFIITFGSTDLIIKQLLALAECRLPMFSFRAWQKYCILSFLSLGRFS